MNIRSISSAGFTSAILLFCIVVGASFLCGSIENTGNPAAGSSGILQVGHGIQPAYENQDPASSADVPVANFSAKAGAITRFSVFFDGTPS